MATQKQENISHSSSVAMEEVFQKIKKIIFVHALIHYQIWKKNLYLSIFLLCYAATLIFAEEVI